MQLGDRVFGESLLTHSWRNGGTWAEYVAAPAAALARIPDNVTYEQAATVPTTGYIALNNIPAERLRPGAEVLVNGAGGGVGTIVVQLAVAAGARVTAVDHPRKRDLLLGLGAAEFVDFTTTDYTASASRYDLVVDIPGNRPFRAARRVLNAAGLYVLIGHDDFGRSGHRWVGSLPRFGGLAARSLLTTQLRRPTGTPLGKAAAMRVLREHLAAGQLTPIVDRTFPLGEAAAALRYLMSGVSLGRIVLTVDADY